MKIPSLSAKIKGLHHEDIKHDFQKFVEYKSILI